MIYECIKNLINVDSTKKEVSNINESSFLKRKKMFKRPLLKRGVLAFGFLKRFLLILIILAIISFIFSAHYKDYFLEKKLFRVLETDQSLPTVSQRKQLDYASFLKEVEKKNIFSPPPQKIVEPGIDKNELIKVIEGLTLVGIISEIPQKAIIEDKKTGKSFYLKEGEAFLENIELIKIEKDFVILNFYGEKFELYL